MDASPVDGVACVPSDSGAIIMVDHFIDHLSEETLYGQFNCPQH